MDATGSSGRQAGKYTSLLGNAALWVAAGFDAKQTRIRLIGSTLKYFLSIM
jgi:hypothetical protein